MIFSFPILKRRAFSLIEMMVTVGLLGFIIIGLVSMFGYTTRAFRAGMTQSDVLEAGRAATDLLARDLEGLTPASLRYPVGSGNVTNFFVKFHAYTTTTMLGTSVARTNELESFFLLTKENDKWSSVGYVVALPNKKSGDFGLGSLYHYQYPSSGATNNPADLAELFRRDSSNAVNNVPQPSGKFRGTSTNLPTTLERVCDGVIHLRLLAFTPAAKGGGLITNDLSANIIARTNSALNTLGEIEYTFTSNAVPAYLELELAILENEALKKLNALPDLAKARYLARPQTAGRIHVFRRRIPIHNVINDAYPD